MEFEDLKVEVPLDEENGSHLLDVTVKKYQNQDGSNFITGFDVTSKEAEVRRLRRARRFGLSNKEKIENATEIEALPRGKNIILVDSVHELLEFVIVTVDSGVGNEEFCFKKCCVQNLPMGNQDAKVRPDAILLFGVNEMSTKDVFDYFQDFMPGSIEWIDDISCVVVWEDENSAKRAFANIGTKFTPSADNSICEDEQLENIWKIGKKHPKSKQLLMRYATQADKKIKGAGSRSLYYLIHGRPEQQKRKANKRGIVSSSRKRKIKADQSRVKTELSQSPEVEIVDMDPGDDMDTFDDMDVDEPAIKVLISEDMPGEDSPAGNLYADQEKNSSIRSRLSKLSADVIRERSERFMKSLPNSAKMDEERLKKNINVAPQTSDINVRDLRQKLKNRKQRFESRTRPNLSIEVTED